MPLPKNNKPLRKRRNYKKGSEISMNRAIGSSWSNLREEIFTPKEIAESDIRVALVGEIIKARKEKGIIQGS